MGSLSPTNKGIGTTRQLLINGKPDTRGLNRRKGNTAVAVVKSEKRSRETEDDDVGDGEYDEWAKERVNLPMPQLGPANPNLRNLFHPGHNTLLVQGFGNPVATISFGADGLNLHNGFDMESAIGRFTWHTFGKDKHIPCIYRSGDLYCCVRMAEPILGHYLRTLQSEITDAVILTSHEATQAEAKLLTFINSWHCNGAYGVTPFSSNDLLVKVPEVEKYFAFLFFSYQVLESGGGNKTRDFSKCGFLQIDQGSLIPYTVMAGNDKGIPLLYFESQDVLKLNSKSELLSGWEYAYLKLCCKLQGVRKDLLSAEALRIVKLADLKAHFPKRTTFLENTWPRPKRNSILLKLLLKHSSPSTTSPRWTTKVLPNDSFDKSRSNAATVTTRPLMAWSISPAQYAYLGNRNLPNSSITNRIAYAYPASLNGPPPRLQHAVRMVKIA